MNEPLQQALSRHAAWLRLARTWTLVQGLAFALTSLAALLILTDRLLFLNLHPLSLGAALAALGLASVGVYFLAVPSPPARVSYWVDRQTGLKNLVASGVECAGTTDDVARAVVDRATAALHQHHPRTVFPLRLSACGRWSWIPAVLLAGALVMPPLDLAHRHQRQLQAVSEAAAVREGALRLAASMAAVSSNTPAASALLDQRLKRDLKALTEQLPNTPRTEALVKLTEFEARCQQPFEAQRDFESAARGLAAQPNLDALPTQSRAATEQLTQSLKQGDFAKAGDALRDLARQLAGTSLTDVQKQALARELGKVASALKDSETWRALADALRKLESSRATSPDLLNQCRQAASQCADAASECQAMQELKAMQEGLAQAKQAMLGDSFKNFHPEAVAKAMAREAATLGMQGQGQGQGQGMGSCPGAGSGEGNGTGGQGRGRGGQPPENITDTAFKSRFSAGKVRQGTILQQFAVSGIPTKGDALVDYRETVEAARQQAASSLAQEHIPQEYESMVKSYFDSLDKAGAPAAPAP